MQDFCSNGRHILRKINAKFCKTDQIISNEIEKYKQHDKQKYCALVYLFFFKNKTNFQHMIFKKKKTKDL